MAEFQPSQPLTNCIAHTLSDLQVRGLPLRGELQVVWRFQLQDENGTVLEIDLEHDYEVGRVSRSANWDSLRRVHVGWEESAFRPEDAE